MGNQSANLFFKNLDPTITSKKLEEDCSKFGSIISCVVKVDEESNKPLGYGYVQFETPQHAEECVNAMNNIKLGEKNRVDPKNEIVKIIVVVTTIQLIVLLLNDHSRTSNSTGSTSGDQTNLLTRRSVTTNPM